MHSEAASAAASELQQQLQSSMDHNHIFNLDAAGSFTVTMVTSYRGLTMVSPSLQPPYQGSDLESVPRFSGRNIRHYFLFNLFDYDPG